MTPTFDVLVLGDYSIDLIFSGMTELFQLGKDTLSTSFHTTPGEAFISAVGMHRLGLKVGWAADFGNDEYSQLALKFIRHEGLDESLFVFHNRPYRRISIAASYPNERGFLTYYDHEPDIPAALFALTKHKAEVVYLSGLYYGKFLAPGARLAHFKRMKIVMDGNSSSGDILGSSSECRLIKSAIKHCDLFLPNASEARRLTGQDDLMRAIKILGKLCPIIVVKDGSNGSIALSNNELVKVPAIPVSPVDTTGAGDNFNAGFLLAWLDGQSLETCLKWGNITGGLSTTELGGTTKIITLKMAKDAFHRNYSSVN